MLTQVRLNGILLMLVSYLMIAGRGHTTRHAFPGSMQCSTLVLLLNVLLLAPAAQQTQGSCPGVQHATCGLECQAATCRALAGFGAATYNASYSGWNRYGGWEGTVADCVAHTTNSTTQLARFCSRYGVECCEGADFTRGECSVRGAVTGIVLEVNFLNGSISDPILLAALSQLHACGLTKLVLQGNDMSGTLSDAWGNLTQLTYLNLGEQFDCGAPPPVWLHSKSSRSSSCLSDTLCCWCTILSAPLSRCVASKRAANNWLNGTLPDSLRRLTKLQRLSLGANFMSGRLPDWLGELKELRELRLGANLGTGSAGGRSGFYGTIPKSLGRLTELQVGDERPSVS